MSEHLDVLIKGGLVVTGQRIVRADVGIHSGKVAEVAPEIAPERAGRVIDATGKLRILGHCDHQEGKDRPGNLRPLLRPLGH